MIEIIYGLLLALLMMTVLVLLKLTRIEKLIRKRSLEDSVNGEGDNKQA